MRILLICYKKNLTFYILILALCYNKDSIMFSHPTFDALISRLTLKFCYFFAQTEINDKTLVNIYLQFCKIEMLWTITHSTGALNYIIVV